MRTKKIQLTVACTISALTLFLTGCSGDSGGQGSSDGGTSGRSSADDKRAKANDCLREKGAEVTEPEKPGEPGAIRPGKLSQDEFVRAMKDCEVGPGAPNGGGGAGGGITQAQKDKMLAYAECMRDEGIEYPDPDFESGSAKLPQIPQGDKDAFAAADKVCAAKTG
ncbi:hypothetical protein ABTZ59_33600 [Streptomyces sp. NPDC094034]|uniref:hypothetical protein n=1 Tax=Streptomyces sp. NPDC094034 TaxID=3155309 RepID=UPI0033297C4F